MITARGMRLLLLLFALGGFAGAGAALAVGRFREVDDGGTDVGLAAIAGLFLLFGILCTLAVGGLTGILAFGGVIVWAAYLIMAQRLGLFRIETRPAPPAHRETSRRT